MLSQDPALDSLCKHLFSKWDWNYVPDGHIFWRVPATAGTCYVNQCCISTIVNGRYSECSINICWVINGGKGIKCNGSLDFLANAKSMAMWLLQDEAEDTFEGVEGQSSLQQSQFSLWNSNPSTHFSCFPAVNENHQENKKMARCRW